MLLIVTALFFMSLVVALWVTYKASVLKRRAGYADRRRRRLRRAKPSEKERADVTCA